MSDLDEEVGEARLHLAGTKPAMVPVIDLPWTALVLLIGITAILAEIYWKLAFMAAPLWPAGFYIFRKDHNALRVIGAWLRTSALDFYGWWFGATSVEVFPRTFRGAFRGIPSDE